MCEAAVVAAKQTRLYFYTPRIVKVGDHVHVAIGYSLGNMIMIEGNDGIIILDTTENDASALKILKDFRKITNKPIKAIVLTHFHTDHIAGTAALLESCEDGGKGVKVFAHAKMAEQRDHFMTRTDVYDIGVNRQFGLNLSENPALKLENKLLRVVEPTDTFEHELNATVAGINFTLIHTPGETDDQINMWIPEWRVVMTGDNIYKAFPNLYAIRGTPPRNSETWYRSLDKVRRLKARFLVPSHFEPIVGEEEVESIVCHYRDAIQFVHDQTVRLLNNGLDVDEIVEKVRLPPRLAFHPYLLESYGTVVWSVRGVIDGHIGWFDRDPASLYPLSKQVQAERWNVLLEKDFGSKAGGVEKMLAAAEEGMKEAGHDRVSTGKIVEEDAQWSLNLLSNVLMITDADSLQHKKALNLSAACLRLLSRAVDNPNAKRYYLTSAKELSSNFLKLSTLKRRARKIKEWPIDYAMNRIRYSLKAEACKDQEKLVVIFVFPDVDRAYSYTLRNSVLEYCDDPQFIPQTCQLKFTGHSDVWKQLLTKEKSLESVMESNEARLEGEKDLFERFMNLLEMGPVPTSRRQKSVL